MQLFKPGYLWTKISISSQPYCQCTDWQHRSRFVLHLCCCTDGTNWPSLLNCDPYLSLVFYERGRKRHPSSGTQLCIGVYILHKLCKDALSQNQWFSTGGSSIFSGSLLSKITQGIINYFNTAGCFFIKLCQNKTLKKLNNTRIRLKLM